MWDKKTKKLCGLCELCGIKKQNELCGLCELCGIKKQNELCGLCELCGIKNTKRTLWDKNTKKLCGIKKN
ncbi:MAG: hypothetical protein LBD59_01500 [Prevotellaceae bacterium]|nr:hypothetical protein [Prevotellaceae bacterium]